MALLDPRDRCVIVRIVYDGPALAGKTTNLRALATSLGSEIRSGEEAEGRTLYFDWVDHTGGLFEGMPIRCQIVSVPGQRVLERRRRLLLSTADVVVFVADSRRDRLEENIYSFKTLREIIAPMDPPVGILVQANKRDIDGAMGSDELRSLLQVPQEVAITEASANVGDGCRETFVYSVRLALSRVRELWRQEKLPRAELEIQSSEELYADLKESERRGRNVPPQRRTREHNQGEVVEGGRPSLPDPSLVQDSMEDSIWPIDTGPRILGAAARGGFAPLRRTTTGEWLTESSGSHWILQSPLDALFFDREAAMTVFQTWCRWHEVVHSQTSRPRSVVLWPESAGVWRLWQVVRRYKSLATIARDLFDISDNEALGEGLFRIVDLRLRAEELSNDDELPPMTLESTAINSEGNPVYSGLAPDPLSRLRPKADNDEHRILQNELRPLLYQGLSQEPRRIPEVLASLERAAEAASRTSLARTIREALLFR